MIQRLGANMTRKTRPTVTKTVNFPVSNHYRADGSVEVQNSPAGSVEILNATEQIVYTTRRRSERNLSNMCHHRKEETLMIGDPLVPIRFNILTAGHSGHYVDYYYGSLHAFNAHSTAKSLAYGVSQLNVASPAVYLGNPQVDIDTHFVDVKPDLTAVSLPNFLFELDDVQKLFLDFKKSFQRVRSGAPIPNLKRAAQAKSLAGNHLEYKFGIKPLIGDLEAMFDIISNLKQRLKDFEAAANQVFNTEKTILSETIVKTGSFNYNGSSQNPCLWKGTVTRSKRLGFTYRALPFNVTRGYSTMLQAYLDALGFELNPRIVWDAIPFTFVLDWFFGIGSWLERHKHDTLEIPFLHVDSYIQYKETVTIESSLRLNYGSPDGGTFLCYPWHTTRDYFCRVPCTPQEGTFTGLGWRLPTLNQATLLVSLATVLNPFRGKR